jgi:hypothetical protein
MVHEKYHTSVSPDPSNKWMHIRVTIKTNQTFNASLKVASQQQSCLQSIEEY